MKIKEELSPETTADAKQASSDVETCVIRADLPKEPNAVLAKIEHQDSLGKSTWYEVVYYINGKWNSFADSDTFKDGEKVVNWKYCNECV